MKKILYCRAGHRRLHGACVLHAGFTLRMCHAYCFSTATMLARTCLYVTLYVHCLPCFIIGFTPSRVGCLHFSQQSVLPSLTTYAIYVPVCFIFLVITNATLLGNVSCIIHEVCASNLGTVVFRFSFTGKATFIYLFISIIFHLLLYLLILHQEISLKFKMNIPYFTSMRLNSLNVL